MWIVNYVKQESTADESVVHLLALLGWFKKHLLTNENNKMKS